jgi:hypothetical protein
MSQYYKTDLGIESLKQRSMNLNARQRRLLLLIGTEDFDLLNEQFKQRIASPELLEQLINLGLIADDAPSYVNSSRILKSFESASEITHPNQLIKKNQENMTDAIITHRVNDNLSPEIQADLSITDTHHPLEIKLHTLGFDEVKQLMAQLLQQNCGLMAKQLINRILQASELAQLKLCQMQWITALQESRISSNELNFHLKQINFSLQKIMSS